MPDVTRVLAAVPAAVREWVEGADAGLLEEVAREAAVRVARELIACEGEAGLGLWGTRRLEGSWSPSAAAIAAGIPRGRRWTANAVAGPVCQFFGLHSALDDVRRRISGKRLGEFAPTSQRLAVLH